MLLSWNFVVSVGTARDMEENSGGKKTEDGLCHLGRSSQRQLQETEWNGGNKTTALFSQRRDRIKREENRYCLP